MSTGLVATSVVTGVAAKAVLRAMAETRMRMSVESCMVVA